MFRFLMVICILCLLCTSCSVNWAKAIQRGSVSALQNEGELSFEMQKDLNIVPVIIQGKKYRFLFDSGAPFSISKALYKAIKYKVISKANIVDTDQNRSEVNWVKVDSIRIGGVLFENQSAFVGDFEANPVIRCLGIDGIVGSNIMRHMNWEIDSKNQKMLLHQRTIQDTSRIIIPFKTDHQYDMYIDIVIGSVKMKNVLVDFGSNAYFSLNEDMYTILKENQQIKNALSVEGVQQSGIIGKAVPVQGNIALIDSLQIGGHLLKNIRTRPSRKVSLGNAFLSQFYVVVNWSKRELHLTPNQVQHFSTKTLGFKLAASQQQGMYVASVAKGSKAYEAGIRSNMVVLQLDQLDFESESNFCDYVDHSFQDVIFMKLKNEANEILEFRFGKTDLKE